jgi:hypothetical protein
MALTASGQLSLGDIATEMGVSPSNVSLTTQSTTGINTNSESKPDGSTPHAVSEFYSYDHSASPSLTAFNVDENSYEDGDSACAFGEPNTEWYHDGAGAYPTDGDTVYTDSDGTTNPGDGVYWMDTPASFIVTGGTVSDVTPCE